ncbi:class I SAM-dependent methyltransferase [Microterricola viridarii]|uniref:Methyltransferase type 11 n=1 Tax=Microterricola viridarii TaxID=412690 RepID=A0A120I0I1_9MICO|nr:class I SAM-dependent methyltransferase [Microterricola viridarii]AMB58835.1 methyltransferase type 11 [Microterricola viridarii]
MVNYSSAYRRYGRRVTPWERYAQVSGTAVAEVFQQELEGRAEPPGRALDLGCGRGTYTPELARLGWDAVGVDAAPEAIAGAQRRGDAGIRYVIGDVTELEEAGLGRFDLFVDIGCFQGLGAEQREAMGCSVTALANPGATLLMFAFGWTRFRSMIEGVSRDEIEDALPGWEMLAAWPAPTAGLGWPMDRTSPQWYRLGLRAS